MLSYEEQTKKLLSKRETLEKRMREDGAEIDKITYSSGCCRERYRYSSGQRCTGRTDFVL